VEQKISIVFVLILQTVLTRIFFLLLAVTSIPLKYTVLILLLLIPIRHVSQTHESSRENVSPAAHCYGIFKPTEIIARLILPLNRGSVMASKHRV